MNDYYSGRSSRPAAFFSFGLLDGPQEVRVSRHGRLTKTRPAHHLAGVHTRHAPWRSWGWAGARTGFGLSRFSTPFMNNPG
jgi:hypothetical protein